MEVEFMTADTALPPCMPLPRAMLRLPISSTAKVMYARMLDIVFLSGIEDANGILFIHFPIVELAAALARSTMTVKRSLNELEDAGLILRVRQGFGEPNKIISPIQEHSRKPEEARDKIVALMGDVPRVELFARQSPPGWDVWGNEVESTIPDFWTKCPEVAGPERSD